VDCERKETVFVLPEGGMPESGMPERQKPDIIEIDEMKEKIQ